MNMLRISLLRYTGPTREWVADHYIGNAPTEPDTANGRVRDTHRFYARHTRGLSATLFMTAKEFLDEYDGHLSTGPLDVFLLEKGMNVDRIFGYDCPLTAMMNSNVVESDAERTSAARRAGWRESWLYRIKSTEPCVVVRREILKNGRTAMKVTCTYVEALFDRAPFKINCGMPIHFEGTTFSGQEDAWFEWGQGQTLIDAILSLPDIRRPNVYGLIIDYKRELPHLAVILAMKEINMSLRAASIRAVSISTVNDNQRRRREPLSASQEATNHIECTIVGALANEGEKLLEMHIQFISAGSSDHIPFSNDVDKICADMSEAIHLAKGCAACFNLKPPTSFVLSFTKDRLAGLSELPYPSYPDPKNPRNIKRFIEQFMRHELRENGQVLALDNSDAHPPPPPPHPPVNQDDSNLTSFQSNEIRFGRSFAMALRGTSRGRQPQRGSQTPRS